MKVTQQWQDELADLAQRVEMKITEFKEQQVLIESMFSKQITRESLEQAKRSIFRMNTEHDELQDVYNQWYYKTNKIIEERKEQRQLVAANGSGTSHKCMLGACWRRKAIS